jgi:tetratricopeptide (TPR) repeat protein
VSLNSIRVFVVTLLISTAGCRDPLSLRLKCVINGNKLYDKGKFKEASLLYRRALQFDAKYADAYYHLGLAYLKLSSYPSAAAAFRRVVQLDPNNDDACVRLGDLYVRARVREWNNYARNQIVDGLKPLVERLLRKNPKSFDGLRLAGYLARVEGDHKSATQKFRAANDVQPWDPETVLALVEELIAGGDGGVEQFGTGLMGRHKDFTPIYAALYVYYIQTSQFDRAEDISRQRIANMPSDGGARIQLALFYYMRDRTGDMLNVLEDMRRDRVKLPGTSGLIGEFYMRIGDLNRAIEAYREGARLNPKENTAYEQRAIEALAAQGRFSEATAAAERLHHADPGSLEAAALRLILRAQANPGAIAKTIVDLESLAMKDPMNPVIHYYLGRACRDAGGTENLEKAKAHFEISAGLRPDFAIARIALAQVHLVRHADESAVQIADDVLRIEPGNLEARLIRATALKNLHLTREARQDLLTTLEMHSESNAARFQLATLDFSDKRYDDAEAGFTALAQTGDPRGLAGVAESKAARGQIREGIGLLEQECLNAAAPDESRLALASLLFRTGQFAEARDLLERLLEKNPSSTDLYLHLGETRVRLGDAAGALAAFRKAHELNPGDAAAAFGFARALELSGQRQFAASAYEEVLKIDPNDPRALNNLAYLKADMGVDLDRALTMAQKAVESMPGQTGCLDTLAMVYNKRGLSDVAIRIFQGLVKNDPENPSLHLHLAMALYSARQRNQAREELQLAMNRNLPADEQPKSQELAAQLR